jgi:hypothetical protein
VFQQLQRFLQLQGCWQQPQPQPQQEQSILPQLPGLQLPVSSSGDAAPQLPGLQLPTSSGDVAAPQPLLCIKRTYQPHPRRYKRKHGFLRR